METETLDPWAPQDPLGEALHFLRMSGAFYCRSELTAPWGMTLPPMRGYMWFHIVVSGAIEIEDAEGGVTRLERDDLALVPRGEGHVLRSEDGVAVPGILSLDRHEVSDRYEVLRHGGGGHPTTLICGAMRFDDPAAKNLVSLLPPTVLVRAGNSPQMERIQGVLRLMAAEARELNPGGEAVITRLGDILVIQAIRSWIETDPAARRGWLGALQDPYIGKAIAMIHADPARDWTVAALADELAMSRSAFAARFTDLVGEPAMTYVTRWRMQLADEALRSEGATVATLADRLGYRSEASFARAFKRVIGSAPGAVRRAAKDQGPQLSELAPRSAAAAATA